MDDGNNSVMEKMVRMEWMVPEEVAEVAAVLMSCGQTPNRSLAPMEVGEEPEVVVEKAAKAAVAGVAVLEYSYSIRRSHPLVLDFSQASVVPAGLEDSAVSAVTVLKEVFPLCTVQGRGFTNMKTMNSEGTAAMAPMGPMEVTAVAEPAASPTAPTATIPPSKPRAIPGCPAVEVPMVG